MGEGDEARQALDWQETYARLERVGRAVASGGERSPDEVAKILEERARRLARPRQEAAEPAETLELLVFSLAGEAHGVDTAHVLEVVPRRSLTRVPGTPDVYAGVIHQRGRILPVLDLRRLLDLPGRESAATDRVVELEVAGMAFGILADRVDGVLRVPADELTPPPVAEDGTRRRLVRAITRQGVAVLDLEALAAAPRVVVNEEVG